MDEKSKVSERISAMGYTLSEHAIMHEEKEVLRFSSIEAYDAGKFSGVIATHGGISYWITPALLKLDDKRRPYFHEIWHEEDLDLVLGSLGALQYILNTKTGFPVSEGHHAITRGTEGLYGTTGARKSTIELMSPNEGLDTFHSE